MFRVKLHTRSRAEIASFYVPQVCQCVGLAKSRDWKSCARRGMWSIISRVEIPTLTLENIELWLVLQGPHQMLYVVGTMFRIAVTTYGGFAM
jgi:hypothetical protein